MSTETPNSATTGPSPTSPNSVGGQNASHMPPPPLPPVIIPQNTNPIPTAMTTSPITSPGGAGGGFVRRAAPEPNKRALYVGNLDPRVTEDILKQIFETAGHVQSVKIIPDKKQKPNNYGFVEFDDPGAAMRALETLNGRRIHQSEIVVNWAYQSNQQNKEDTSAHFHIFVGDLSNEVNDETLLGAFQAFGSVSEARVMWDMKTGRSRGYGFVAFRERTDAEKALSTMDGEWLGSRSIRCNWANQKGQPPMQAQNAMAAMGLATPFGHHQYPTQGVGSYEMVVQQTPQHQTTVYVGNLTPYTTQNDLVPLFQNFGYVIETRFQADRGFAFVKMDSHENAAMSICQLSGYIVNGRGLKCSWGKDRSPQQAGFPQSPVVYGMPQSPFSPFQQQGFGGPMSPTGPSGNARPNNFPGQGQQSPATASPRWAQEQQQQQQFPTQSPYSPPGQNWAGNAPTPTGFGNGYGYPQ